MDHHLSEVTFTGQDGTQSWEVMRAAASWLEQHWQLQFVTRILVEHNVESDSWHVSIVCEPEIDPTVWVETVSIR